MKIALLLCLLSPLLAYTPCGNTTSKSRFERHIIGGNEVTKVGKWPWQVLLKRFGGKFRGLCGGTVISENWILTAAHCLHFKYEDKVYEVTAINVVPGITSSRMGDFRDAEHWKVIRSIQHHYYIDTNKSYDIALLKLEKPLKFGNSVSPICLPNAGQSIPSATHATITGFGERNDAEDDQDIIIDFKNLHLRETTVQIVETEICIELYRGGSAESKHALSKGTICAGSRGHGAAKGDSGGPLMMKSTAGHWYEIGITSFGSQNHKTKADLVPNVYTDVREYCTWIEENTEGEASCQKKKVILQDSNFIVEP